MSFVENETAASETEEITPDLDESLANGVEETIEDEDTEILDDEAASTEGDEDDAPEGAEDKDEDDEPAGEDPLYEVTIDGEVFEVPLSELANGYLRQSDYTRKTQAVAAERERVKALESLEANLKRDPQGTLTYLARQFGVDFAAEAEDIFDDLDPQAKEIRELRAWRESVEEKARLDAINAEVKAVREKYKDETVTDEDILQYAVDNQIGNLDAAYRAFKFEQKVADTTETKEAAKEVKIAAKRKAAVVGTSSKARRSKGVIKGGDQLMSLEDAVRLAMQPKN